MAEELPIHLVDRLTFAEQKALEHPVRRQILRLLAPLGGLRTSQELTRSFPHLTLAQLNYHILVLTQRDCLAALHGHDGKTRYGCTISKEIEGALEQLRLEDER
jgi:hypothetical protein